MKERMVAFFYHFISCIIRFAFFFYYSIRIEGREYAPPKTESAIFASNHRSYLDPVLVVLAAPHPFNFVAKEDLFKYKLFGKFIWSLGAFPATWTADPSYDMLSEAVRRLNNNRHLTIFPEGTRHTDGKVGAGKSGMCVLSARSGKPIIPVGLIFNSNNLHFRSKICIRLGKPFYPEDYGLTPDSTPREMRQMKTDVMAAIKELVEENPPFPIKHDMPKKRSSVDEHRMNRRKQLRERRAMADSASEAAGQDSAAS